MGNELFRELAGFGSANGSLGAAIPVDGILVPGRVELIAGRLKWEMASGAGGRVLEPPEGLLDLFMGLGEKDDEAIVSFASHYGMIMPSSVHPSMGYTPHGSEPIDIWRDLARRAKALINLAAAALQPRPVFELRDLDVLSTSNPCSLPAESDADENLAITGLSISRYIKPGVEVVPDSIYIRLEEDDTTPMLTWVRDVVAFEVSEWLRLGRVSVRVYPDEVSGWEVYTDFGGNLLGALALQMAIAVTRARHGLHVFRVREAVCETGDQSQEPAP